MAKARAQKIHDRQSADIPINARVAVTVVDDPMARYLGEKISVVRSIRDDPLAGMHARRQIDDVQLAAGRLWQRHHETSEIGIQAIDTTKEVVDGGCLREPITDRQRKAFSALAEARSALGPTRAVLVSDILGHRIGIRQAAEARGLWSKYGWENTGREFRSSLDTLVGLWGLSTKRLDLRGRSTPNRAAL